MNETIKEINRNKDPDSDNQIERIAQVQRNLFDIALQSSNDAKAMLRALPENLRDAFMQYSQHVRIESVEQRPSSLPPAQAAPPSPSSPAPLPQTQVQTAAPQAPQPPPVDRVDRGAVQQEIRQGFAQGVQDVLSKGMRDLATSGDPQAKAKTEQLERLQERLLAAVNDSSTSIKDLPKHIEEIVRRSQEVMERGAERLSEEAVNATRQGRPPATRAIESEVNREIRDELRSLNKNTETRARQETSAPEVAQRRMGGGYSGPGIGNELASGSGFAGRLAPQVVAGAVSPELGVALKFFQEAQGDIRAISNTVRAIPSTLARMGQSLHSTSTSLSEFFDPHSTKQAGFARNLEAAVGRGVGQSFGSSVVTGALASLLTTGLTGFLASAAGAAVLGGLGLVISKQLGNVFGGQNDKQINKFLGKDENADVTTRERFGVFGANTLGSLLGIPPETIKNFVRELDRTNPLLHDFADLISNSTGKLSDFVTKTLPGVMAGAERDVEALSQAARATVESLARSGQNTLQYLNEGYSVLKDFLNGEFKKGLTDSSVIVSHAALDFKKSIEDWKEWLGRSINTFKETFWPKQPEGIATPLKETITGFDQVPNAKGRYTGPDIPDIERQPYAPSLRERRTGFDQIPVQPTLTENTTGFDQLAPALRERSTGFDQLPRESRLTETTTGFDQLQNSRGQWRGSSVSAPEKLKQGQRNEVSLKYDEYLQKLPEGEAPAPPPDDADALAVAHYHDANEDFARWAVAEARRRTTPEQRQRFQDRMSRPTSDGGRTLSIPMDRKTGQFPDVLSPNQTQQLRNFSGVSLQGREEGDFRGLIQPASTEEPQAGQETPRQIIRGYGRPWAPLEVTQDNSGVSGWLRSGAAKFREKFLGSTDQGPYRPGHDLLDLSGNPDRQMMSIFDPKKMLLGALDSVKHFPGVRQIQEMLGAGGDQAAKQPTARGQAQVDSPAPKRMSFRPATLESESQGNLIQPAAMQMGGGQEGEPQQGGAVSGGIQQMLSYERRQTEILEFFYREYMEKKRGGAAGGPSGGAGFIQEASFGGGDAAAEQTLGGAPGLGGGGGYGTGGTGDGFGGSRGSSGGYGGGARTDDSPTSPSIPRGSAPSVPEIGSRFQGTQRGAPRSVPSAPSQQDRSSPTVRSTPAPEATPGSPLAPNTPQIPYQGEGQAPQTAPSLETKIPEFGQSLTPQGAVSSLRGSQQGTVVSTQPGASSTAPTTITTPAPNKSFDDVVLSKLPAEHRAGASEFLQSIPQETKDAVTRGEMPMSKALEGLGPEGEGNRAVGQALIERGGGADAFDQAFTQNRTPTQTVTTPQIEARGPEGAFGDTGPKGVGDLGTPQVSARQDGQAPGIVSPVTGTAAGGGGSVYGAGRPSAGGGHRDHSGIDWQAPNNSPVKAMTSGEVLYAGRNSGYGANVVVKGDDGLIRRYAAHGSIAEGLKPGSRVEQGQTIGRIGEGHLHYEEIPKEIGGKPNPVYNEMVKRPGDFISTSNQKGTVDPFGEQGSLGQAGIERGERVTAGKALGDAPQRDGAPVAARQGSAEGAEQDQGRFGRIASSVGVTPAQTEAFRKGMVNIESRGGQYGIMGGSSNRFAGAYQMGGAEIAETARQLGETPPVMRRESDGKLVASPEFLKNPEMQDRYFDQYTKNHHDYLMKNSPGYRNMTPEQKLGALGYAHNQGPGGARKWIESGQAGRDAFGTSGTAYPRSVQKELSRLKDGDRQIPSTREAGQTTGRSPQPSDQDADLRQRATPETQANQPGARGPQGRVIDPARDAMLGGYDKGIAAAQARGDQRSVDNLTQLRDRYEQRTRPQDQTPAQQTPAQTQAQTPAQQPAEDSTPRGQQDERTAEMQNISAEGKQDLSSPTVESTQNFLKDQNPEFAPDKPLGMDEIRGLGNKAEDVTTTAQQSLGGEAQGEPEPISAKQESSEETATAEQSGSGPDEANILATASGGGGEGGDGATTESSQGSGDASVMSEPTGSSEESGGGGSGATTEASGAPEPSDASLDTTSPTETADGLESANAALGGVSEQVESDAAMAEASEASKPRGAESDESSGSDRMNQNQFKSFTYGDVALTVHSGEGL